MGWNSPRYSAGALGFMSHMSMWEAPPQRKKRTVDLAVLLRGSAGWAEEAVLPKGRPKQAAVEAVRKERRLKREPKRPCREWDDMSCECAGGGPAGVWDCAERGCFWCGGGEGLGGLRGVGE